MNQHDLHSAFGHLARRGADEQAARLHRGDGLSAPVITRRAAQARRRRTAVTAVTGVAAVAGLVLAGSALAARPDPQPADTPTITHPTPAPTPTPSKSATAVLPDAGTGDAEPTAATSGLLQPYPTAPTVGWTTPVDDLWTPRRAENVGLMPMFGDVTSSPHVYPGFRALAAGSTWLVAVGQPYDEQLTGVDAGTGDARWAWPDATGERVLSCGGVYDDLLVCLRAGADPAASEIQLRDPVTGAVVRAVGSGGTGIAVVGDAVVVHRVDGADVEVRVLDLDDGSVRAEHILRDRADQGDVLGDPVVMAETIGSLLRVHGVGYSFAMDVSTGSLLAEGMAPVGLRGDGWVTAQAADGSSHAVGLEGEDVLLPGTPASSPTVWSPASEIDVPLLTWSDSGDGQRDSVSAVDSGSGDVLWSVAGASVVQAVAGRTAVLLGDDALIGVDVVTGDELWRTGLGNVVGYDGERVVIDDAVGARAVRAVDGVVDWTLALDPARGVLAVDGTLALTGADGSLSALAP